jgi:hypothetical protein
MGKRESQQVAYAVLELEDAHELLRAFAAGEVGPEELAAALPRMSKVVKRLEGTIPDSLGLPVASAADYLGVSEPTVRSWLKRGVLRAVPSAKPVVIELPSLRSAHRAIEELRERGQDRDWLRALVDYLDDLAVRESPEVQRGLAELEAGELEPA